MKNILTILLAAMGVIGCAKQPVDHLRQATIKHLKGHVTVDGQKARLSTPVREKSEIVVGPRAMAMLHFPNAATVTLTENSKIVLTHLEKTPNDRLRIDFSQSSGSSFSKVEKGQSRFVIRTPTAVAGVRGTSFYTEVLSSSETRIKLLEGKVEVSLPEQTPESRRTLTLLEAGQMTTVKADKKIQPVEMTQADLESLRILNSVDGAGAQTALVMPKNLEEHYTGKADVFAAESVVTEGSLAAIRAKYGKVARVKTSDGRSVDGYFLQVGNKMEIITPSGKIVVPIANVVKVTPIP